MSFHRLSSGRIVVIGSILVIIVYLLKKLRYKRLVQNAHLPQLAPSSVWGHLVVFDKFTKAKPDRLDRHPDDIFNEIYETLGRPPVMVVDFWPIIEPIVVVNDHRVAEQISRPSTKYPFSTPKGYTLGRLVQLIGPSSIILKEGHDWKAVRKRFNPGFAPQHLMTLLPVITEQARIYLDNLDYFSRTGEVFSLDHHTTNLTFDIIVAVTMGEDARAQRRNPSEQSELIHLFKELIKTFTNDKHSSPWWLIPRVHLNRWRLGRLITQQLNNIIHRNFQRVKDEKISPRSRSVLALSLQDVDVLTPEILQVTCDQLKSFLFAGHDTTSTLIVWMVYELSRTPHVLQAVRDEIDAIFGVNVARDPSAICERLMSNGGGECISQMIYVSAVIKETLRLHPPAGTIRMASRGEGLVVSTSQGDYNLDGNSVYLNQSMIHRDKHVYGDDADEFIPQRWLKSNNLPPSAWRPFETGPRNCIGLELVNIEARLVVALIAHRYTFEKVGLGELQLDNTGKPMLNQKNQFMTRSELYSKIQITSKPVDNMVVKVYRNC